jgi:hypothetical protein
VRRGYLCCSALGHAVEAAYSALAKAAKATVQCILDE